MEKRYAQVTGVYLYLLLITQVRSLSASHTKLRSKASPELHHLSIC
ncbi:hypothetical protein [Gloeocapsopsis sp. IPPAS B-1203]|nr:hypothetical protein [Gloeocapsopsis sp. IPPAS B-1203]